MGYIYNLDNIGGLQRNICPPRSAFAISNSVMASLETERQGQTALTNIGETVVSAINIRLGYSEVMQAPLAYLASIDQQHRVKYEGIDGEASETSLAGWAYLNNQAELGRKIYESEDVHLPEDDLTIATHLMNSKDYNTLFAFVSLDSFGKDNIGNMLLLSAIVPSEDPVDCNGVVWSASDIREKLADIVASKDKIQKNKDFNG